MAKRFLLEPEGLRVLLRRRFENARSDWLRGRGEWPLRLTLGVPTEAQAVAHFQQVERWRRAWAGWSGPGEVRWTERRWPGLGTQRLPEAIVMPHAQAVAELIGLAREWREALTRLEDIGQRWPTLEETAARAWGVLGKWPAEEFQRLLSLLEWLQRHPDSGLLVRQLPVPGVHGKWLERHGRVLSTWLACLQQRKRGDLVEVAGLRRPPHRLRLRLLDPSLRQCFAGLSDLEAPLEEIAALDLPVRQVFIVENLQTGLAFEDLPGSLVFMQQGYAVEPFGAIPWLKGQPVYYWGDIDTHGLAILDRLRTHVPHARSLLMDEATLVQHRPLWGHEARPANATRLDRLTDAESALYQDLRQGRWGPGVRLEQERIAWPYAWERILDQSSPSQ